MLVEQIFPKTTQITENLTSQGGYRFRVINIGADGQRGSIHPDNIETFLQSTGHPSLQDPITIVFDNRPLHVFARDALQGRNKKLEPVARLNPFRGYGDHKNNKIVIISEENRRIRSRLLSVQVAIKHELRHLAHTYEWQRENLTLLRRLINNWRKGTISIGISAYTLATLAEKIPTFQSENSELYQLLGLACIIWSTLAYSSDPREHDAIKHQTLYSELPLVDINYPGFIESIRRKKYKN